LHDEVNEQYAKKMACGGEASLIYPR